VESGKGKTGAGKGDGVATIQARDGQWVIVLADGAVCKAGPWPERQEAKAYFIEHVAGAAPPAQSTEERTEKEEAGIVPPPPAA